MDVRFAFEHVGKSFFGNVHRPVAKVSFESPKENIWIDTWLIVDTGADFTILPEHFSHDLGISLQKDCIKDKTRGVGGQGIIYLCKLKIKAKIGHIERNIPLAFFETNEVPALMGRLGFLETFDTEFLKTHVLLFKN